MENYFLWYKTLHIISVIAWMAGLLYLPRLFVYHCRAAKGSELDRTLQIMEYKLQKIIMNPAMISTYVFGSLMAYVYGFVALGVWFHIKFLAVLGLSAMHGMCSKWRREFALGKNQRSEKFYRIINEVPTILMIVAIIMVVFKPFE